MGHGSDCAEVRSDRKGRRTSQKAADLPPVRIFSATGRQADCRQGRLDEPPLHYLPCQWMGGWDSGRAEFCARLGDRPDSFYRRGQFGSRDCRFLVAARQFCQSLPECTRTNFRAKIGGKLGATSQVTDRCLGRVVLKPLTSVNPPPLFRSFAEIKGPLRLDPGKLTLRL